MITGTFNVIVAQRLARKLRDDCKVIENVKEKYPELYKSATQSILTMKAEALNSEMATRGIEKSALSDFMEKGLAYGPDPEK